MRCLTREPQPADVRAQVLMHLQTRAGRPIAVAAEGPGGFGPARIHKRRGFGDVGRAIHCTEDGEDLLFGFLVVLMFDNVGLRGDDRDEEYSGPGEEARAVKRPEDGVVAALKGVGVEEELSGSVPEDFVGRELEEYFCVGG